MTTPQNPFVLGRPAPPFPLFRARWPWIGGDLQTVRNTIHHRAPDFSGFPAQRLVLPAADGTELLAMLNQPATPTELPTVVLVHGLTGCETSRNIMTSAAYHLSRGYPVVRLNLRGAGPSRGKCSGTYHAGRSADIRDAVAALPANLVANGVLLIGVSLGGNACLKFLAEGEGVSRIIAAASVCAPIDLKMSQQRIGSGRNAFYQRHLLGMMHVDALANAGGDQTEIAKVLAGVRTVYDFDDRIVAPRNGFQNAEDYYQRSSAGPLLSAIKVPTLLVHSRTDPWVPAEMYLRRAWQADGALSAILAPDGGHVGFHAVDSTIPWHDRCIGAYFDAARA